MGIGFYYRTREFDIRELLQKCVQQADELPDTIEDIHEFEKHDMTPEQIFHSPFAREWTAPQYDADSIYRLDAPYGELNEKSKQKELEHLEKEYGNAFMICSRVTSEVETSYISCLVQIESPPGGTHDQYYVDECLLEEVTPEDCQGEQQQSDSRQATS